MNSIQNTNNVDKEFSDLERKITWVFTSIGTNKLANLLFSNYANILDEPYLGQHLGIITDRRGDEIVTNFEIHHDREDYLFSEKYKMIWSYYLRKLILARLYSQFGNSQKPIIINDLPIANFASNVIAEVTPNSKVLIFVRDGRDVVNHKAASLIPLGKGLQMGLSFFSQDNRIEFLKMESRKWAKMVSILLDIKNTHDESFVKVIRYEDLLVDPLKELKKIFQFIGIQTDENAIIKLASKTQKSFEATTKKLKLLFWKKDLSNEEQTVIEQIMKESLQKLNYY